MKLICDFCSSKKVVTSYDCPDFVIDEALGMESVGAFAACAQCKALIDAGDSKALEDRALNTYIERYGSLTPHEVLREYMRKLHGKFWQLKRS